MSTDMIKRIPNSLRGDMLSPSWNMDLTRSTTAPSWSTQTRGTTLDQQGHSISLGPSVEMESDTDYLKWDGSYLGSFPIAWRGVVHREFPYGWAEITVARIYTRSLTVDQVTMVCRIHESRDGYACVVDEAAPIFGLPKIGTHTVSYGSKLYTIYRIHTAEVRTLKDISSLTPSPRYKRLVQDVFVYRMIMGLNSNYESSIYVNDQGLPISYRNKLETRAEISPILPSKLIETWFIEDIGTCIERISHVSGGPLFVRCLISDVITRVDKNLSWMGCVICGRLNSLC